LLIYFVFPEIFDQMNLDEQLQNLPTLARLNYVDSANLILSRFNPLADLYQVRFASVRSSCFVIGRFYALQHCTQKAVESSHSSLIQLYETQLAWLIYVMSSLVASQSLPGTLGFGFQSL
jgi:hypothetical protein